MSIFLSGEYVTLTHSQPTLQIPDKGAERRSLPSLIAEDLMTSLTVRQTDARQRGVFKVSVRFLSVTLIREIREPRSPERNADGMTGMLTDGERDKDKEEKDMKTENE